MIEHEIERSILSRLVGGWEGTLRHRSTADQPLAALAGTSENRWVLGGRFVELTLRAGDSWSAVFYIGYERSERRHVLVSLEPGERHVTTRRGEWLAEADRLVLTSQRSRMVCDLAVPGELRLELFEELAPGYEFVRLQAEYRPAAASALTAKPPPLRQHRRVVIA